MSSWDCRHVSSSASAKGAEAQFWLLSAFLHFLFGFNFIPFMLIPYPVFALHVSLFTGSTKSHISAEEESMERFRYAHQAFLSVLPRYTFPHFPNAYGHIYILHDFVFLHDQKGHSVLLCRILEAEDNPWTEHQDPSQSTQPKHLWALENKASEI